MGKLVREILFLKRGERRALFVVAIVLFLSLVFRIIIPKIGYIDPEPDQAFLEQLERLRLELDSLECARRSVPGHFTVKVRSQVPKKEILAHLFDPNKASREELSAMHLPERVISNLISYREAGGVFRSSADIKKIYSLDDSLYHILQDFIRIEEISPKATDQFIQKGSVQNEVSSVGSGKANRIELNAADSADLVRIRGIGPFSARTIIRYRSLLGGYYKLSQLKEVYGMDSSRYGLLQDAVYIDSSFIKTLDINDMSFEELLKHPYISKQQVTDLIHYRDYAKVIVSPEELKKFGIFDSASYAKILPYIRCRIN